MKILFTGASSFTGFWFIRELAAAGHEVFGVFRRPSDEYPEELRRRRVAALLPICRPIFGVSFGDDDFIRLVTGSSWDLFCHHGAEVANYRSADFDVVNAVRQNTYRLPIVLDSLKSVGCSRLILTGSVFENDEGAGSADLRAFSPYGLSKGLTWQIFRHYAQSRQMSLGKFVIPNPFGPYEEPRFTHYLIKSWFAGERPTVSTPSYVRDNIHVSLLAKIYSHFSVTLSQGVTRVNPSGYVECQGAFARRFAREIGQRLGLKCELKLERQTEFLEPHVRINTDSFDTDELNWTETAAWDELTAYYAQAMRGQS